MPKIESTPRTMSILNWGRATVESTKRDIVTFNILVHSNVPLSLRSTGPDAYVVRRRFRQFAQLHQQLTREGFILPDLPKVDVITNLLIKLTPDTTLVERQEQLQHVLDTVNRSRDMQSTHAYAAFIGQPPELKTGYTSLSEYQSSEIVVTITRAKSASVP
ncbi:hypothetical protein H310_13041 [Aphanomyces invadans]|uniref:PX domain-containing protein n=1 Tax=Aphanomyces invadans TaxID=157072 RepID=A0A024TFC4_9STRA|nr:hypothetical protein H310_13041 [Aphanomyces invadans]ETV92850.1 hypothetical protein H310_13041 [Aphanomyces invadans]|eukprot:XP_008878620.1 hypothetical protein H310_13041 [Aphanomyces invadans]